MRGKSFNLRCFGLLICCLALVYQASSQNYGDPNSLTGTYQIDVSRSADVFSLVENATRQNKLLSPQKADLQAKLEPTDSVSIDVNGSRVTLASPISGPTTLNADNKFQTLNANSGTQVSIRTSLIGNTLKVSSIYDNTNYSITFRSLNNGKNLSVTRTVKTNYLQQTIFAESYYERVNSSRLFAGSYRGDNRFAGDDFIVPNGTVLMGVLDNYLSTKDSQNNDQFRILVQSPSQFEGAVIEGYISGIERSNGISGTAKMNLNFQRIKLVNGKIYDFTGVIQSISQAADTSVNKTDKTQLKGKNKTNESVRRGVVAAGVGAIIGAAIGGTKGALIGAGVGGVGGPATLLMEGDSDLVLQKGLQVNIQSTSTN